MTAIAQGPFTTQASIQALLQKENVPEAAPHSVYTETSLSSCCLLDPTYRPLTSQTKWLLDHSFVISHRKKDPFCRGTLALIAPVTLGFAH